MVLWIKRPGNPRVLNASLARLNEDDFIANICLLWVNTCAVCYRSPRTNISSSFNAEPRLWIKCVRTELKQWESAYRTGNLYPEDGQLYVHRIINEFTERYTDVITCGHGTVELITAFVVDQCFLSGRDLWPGKLESMWYRCTNRCSGLATAVDVVVVVGVHARNVNDPADIAAANLLTPSSAPMACRLSFYLITRVPVRQTVHFTSPCRTWEAAE